MPTASELERGSYFIYNGEPVRVLRKEVIVVGTHSHSKLKFYSKSHKNLSNKYAFYLLRTDNYCSIDFVREYIYRD
ncbi:hypothetical protein HYY71_04485 [Candidatus Woesearchaeota archaeon]|nr:hypothetical protein [Candidatus Woesearchaeota archaeon]